MAARSDAFSSGLGRPSRGLYGSDLMVEVLRALGIRYIALNPGASYRGLHDSLVNFGQGESPEIILLVNAAWPVITAGEVGRTPQALVPLRELAETLAAPVIDADGRFAFPNSHPLDLTATREPTLRAADVVLELDVPSLGVPLGPSMRERETLQLAVRPETKIVHITLLESERQSFVSDTMWLLPVAVPIAADTAIALPQLLALCRDQLGVHADTTRRIADRRARATAMRAEAHQRSCREASQLW